MNFTRRELIAGVSTIAIVANSPQASAWTHGVSSQNGGKSQLQFNFLAGGGDYPFINLMKTMQTWTYVSGGNPVNPNDLDGNGYPTVINSGGVSNILYSPTPTQKPGTWVLTWDGRGTVFVTGASATSGSFSNLAGGASGRAEFTMPSVVGNNGVYNQVTVGITALNSNVDYPHNMQLFYKAEETALNNGQIFGTDFLTLLRQGNPGVIRFLNWQNVNASNVTTFATEKPVTHYSYYAYEYRSALNATVNGGDSVNAYTATLGSGAPVDKQTIHVKFAFTAVSNSTWTFELNGTGPLPLNDNSFNNRSSIKPTGTLYATLVYDADLNCWIKFGGYPGNSTGITSGVPPAICAALCKAVGAHPHFVTPPLASDPATDWITGLDGYMQANAPSWMIARYEGPNETFNSVMYVNAYSLQKATAYWGSSNNGNPFWQGRMLSNIGQLLDANRSSNRAKYRWICGVQSSGYANTVTQNPRLNCVRQKGFTSITFTNGSANIVATGNTLSVNDPVQLNTLSSANVLPNNFAKDTTYFVKTSGSTITLAATQGGAAIVAGSAGTGSPVMFAATLSPAFNWVTTVCCTNYSNPTAQNTVGELATAFQLASGTTSVIATYQAANDIVSGILTTSYTNWYNWANGFGVNMGLCAYEGGWSPDYLANTFNAFGIISGATQANPCVLTVSQTNYNGVLSGNPFVVGMPVVIDSVTGMTQLNSSSIGNSVTCSAASLGVFDWGSAHGFAVGQAVVFSSNLFAIAPATPGNISAGIVYYIKNNAPGGNANKFTVSATNGGIEINTTSTGTSVFAAPCYVATAVNGNNVTLNVDASGFSAWASGGRAFIGCAQTGTSIANMVNSLRYASKQTAQLQNDLLADYNNFVGVGARAEFPSCFQLAGTNNAWSVWDVDIYATPTPPQWSAIVSFNH